MTTAEQVSVQFQGIIPMPKQTSKSGLAAKYGNKLGSAVSAHGADQTEYSKFGELPGGIKNGVAQLVECKFDVYKSGPNEGEYYFIAAGVIESPEFHTDGTPMKGLRTQIMEAVCDTTTQAGKTTTQDEHIANILNEMRKLGADTAGIGGEDLENVAASLKEAAPYFRFATSQGDATPAFPNPRVWQNWNGSKGLEDYAPGGGDEIQDDNETAEAEAEEEPLKAKAAPAKAKGKPAPEPEPEPEADVPFGDDLDDLVADANGKDKTKKITATNRLKEIAMEQGHSEEEVDGAADWEAVAEMCRNPAGAGDEADGEADGPDYMEIATRADKADKAAVKELRALAKEAGLDPDSDDYGTWTDLATALAGGSPESEAEEEFVPLVEGVYLWKSPTDKKAKEYEVTKVNAKQETVFLKDGDTKRAVVGKDKQPLAVAWSDLVQE